MKLVQKWGISKHSWKVSTASVRVKLHVAKPHAGIAGKFICAISAVCYGETFLTWKNRIILYIVQRTKILWNCERSHPGQSNWNCWTERQKIPLRDRHHSGNDPQLVPGFPSRCWGMFPERFRGMSVPVGSRETCLTQTDHPKYEILSCWHPETVFLVNPPSISSETCMIYSSVIPGTDVFCDWLFLGYSCVSPETAANFRLFLIVAIFEAKSSTVAKIEISFYFFKWTLEGNEL